MKTAMWMVGMWVGSALVTILAMGTLSVLNGHPFVCFVG